MIHDVPVRPANLRSLLIEVGLDQFDWYGPGNVVVSGVSTNAQRCRRGDLFVAVKGTRVDSHALISEAIERGAAAVLVEQATPPYPGIAIVRVPSTRRLANPLALALLGHPQRSLRAIGVTGTNGKTTTVHLVRNVLEAAGYSCGTIGTLGASWPGRTVRLDTTTPDPLTLAAILAAMVEDGVGWVAMEISSHAIDQHRTAGIPLDVGILTNISQDHLDYHGDFAHYIATKRRLFFDYVLPNKGGVSVFNRDDAVGEELCHFYGGKHVSYSATGAEDAAVRARFPKIAPEGVSFDLIYNGASIGVSCPLTGQFNIANCLAAASAGFALGLSAEHIAQGLATMQPVPGRFERIDIGQPFQVIVDYAHTPDALAKVLRTARQQTTGRLITVFGCGGDRDRSKRPSMGRAVASLSDLAIVTSDNPRGEDPDRIAADTIPGLEGGGMKPAQFHVILDRAHAIERALHTAATGDLVLIAGKGHETEQEILGARYHFDDRETAREVLQKMSAMGWPSVPGFVHSAKVPAQSATRRVEG